MNLKLKNHHLIFLAQDSLKNLARVRRVLARPSGPVDFMPWFPRVLPSATMVFALANRGILLTNDLSETNAVIHSHDQQLFSVKS